LALLVVGSQTALTAAGVQAAELPVVAPAMAVEDALPAQVERLTEHIHGMEGKLKESAAARRTADQARMEAERRLAENLQETARLNAQIGLLREAKAALEERLAHAEEENSRAAERLVVAEEQMRRASGVGEAEPRRGDGPDLPSEPGQLPPGATLVIP
jgi:septal ring factor EnvC (AmiA/AmiB activator)